MTDIKPADRSPVTKGTMLSYGVGQMGAQVVRDTPAVLLPVFMTTLLGVPAWLTGIVVLVSKLWLIICDPLIGALSDKVKPRYGRAPFLIGGAVLTTIGFIGLFSFTGFASPYWAAAAIGGLFFLVSTAFSAYSVPYLAIASELSTDAHERTKILTSRVVFASIGVVLSVGLAQPIVAHLGGGPDAWQTMAVILGGVAIICMLATPFGLRGRVVADSQTVPSGGWLSGLKAARRNLPYVLITTTALIQSSAQACSYTLVGFLFIYAVGKINLLLPFIFFMSAAAVLSQPFWLALSRGIGKRSTFIIATLAWCGIMITWLGVHPGDDVLVTLPLLGPLATQDLIVILRGMGIGITNSGMVLLTLSMLTDTINADRNLDANVDEGLLSGIFSATEKLGFAVGPLIAGFGLSLAGFESSVTGAVAQSSSAISSIVVMYGVIPAAMAMSSLIVIYWYRLNVSEARGQSANA